MPVMERLQRYAPATARTLIGDEVLEDLWELYALSRVNDCLLRPFQPDRSGAMDPSAGTNSAEVYQVFWEALGMRLLAPRQFHPFFHEITAVVQADDPDEPISVLEMRWPAVMFGDLLISRAGAVVRGGINHVRADTAPSSILFFTYSRNYRDASDLSHGWGYNSQWRTKFRRDYMDTEAFYFNVDGTLDVWQPSPTNSGRRYSLRDYLTPQQRHELLVNRCFIISAEHSRDGDLRPYDDTAVEKRQLPL
jgi:hypothetical protein